MWNVNINKRWAWTIHHAIHIRIVFFWTPIDIYGRSTLVLVCKFYPNKREETNTNGMLKCHKSNPSDYFFSFVVRFMQVYVIHQMIEEYNERIKKRKWTNRLSLSLFFSFCFFSLLRSHLSVRTNLSVYIYTYDHQHLLYIHFGSFRFLSFQILAKWLEIHRRKWN